MSKVTTFFLTALTVLAAPAVGSSPRVAAPAHCTAPLAADAALPDYGAYTLTCAANGKLLEVAGRNDWNEKLQDQQLLVQFGSTQGSTWQQWHLIYKETRNGARCYHLRSVVSGKLLTVPANAPQPGTQLQQYREFPLLTDQQLWRVEQTGTAGRYRIINTGNNLALTSTSANDNAPITQQVLHPDDLGQQWALTSQRPTAYRDDAAVRFFERNDPTQGSAAFDEGLSIPLNWGANKGKVLWITQDAADGSSINPATGKFNCGSPNINYSNSLLLQPSITNWASTALNVTVPGGANGRPRQVCEVLAQAANNDKADYQFAWPAAGIEIGSHVYIQCGEGRFSGPTVEGTQSLYDFTESATGTQWTTKRTVPNGLGKGIAISYAAGMVNPAGDPYVYVFGGRATNFQYAADIHVARFPLTDPQAWTYWDGAAWRATPVTGAAARVAEGKGSSNVGYVNGKYVLMTMGQGYNCGDTDRSIYLATANSPTGPFTPFTKVYDIGEHMYGQVAKYYTPGVHPEFVNGRDELLLTYCLNFGAEGCAPDPCRNGVVDPYFYRVKGIRVPYSLVGIVPSVITATTSPAAPADLTLFPNPATDRLRLIGTGLAGAHVSIHNAVGQRVWQGSYRGQALDVAQLPAGVYLLTVAAPNQPVVSRRFVK